MMLMQGIFFMNWTQWYDFFSAPTVQLSLLNEVQLPELTALQWVPQCSLHHPEGNAWTHTILVVDEMADIISREGIWGIDKVVLLFAALTHDWGKLSTTSWNLKKNRYGSPGHDKVSADMAREFLTKMGAPQEQTENIVALVRQHMYCNNTPTRKSYRKLVSRLAPATVTQLLLLIEADFSGRSPLPKGLPINGQKLKEIHLDSCVSSW